MNNSYVEVLVKREPMKGYEMLKKVIAALTILWLAFGLLLGNLLVLLFAVVLGLIYYFKILRMNVEFEYFYMDGEFEFTRIFIQTKRKSFMTLNETMIELVAPLTADEVDYYGHAKEIDCSAKNPEEAPYVIVCNYKGAVHKVYIQMNEELLKAMKRQMPGKVRMR